MKKISEKIRRAKAMERMGIRPFFDVQIHGLHPSHAIKVLTKRAVALEKLRDKRRAAHLDLKSELSSGLTCLEQRELDRLKCRQ